MTKLDLRSTCLEINDILYRTNMIYHKQITPSQEVLCTLVHHSVMTISIIGILYCEGKCTCLPSFDCDVYCSV